MKNPNTLEDFNACKTELSKLFSRRGELTPSQREQLTEAWVSWNLFDDLGRRRAIKIVRSLFNESANTMIEKLEAFNRNAK